MIIVKGHAVSFDLAKGLEIDARAEHGMMHDPTGRYWKKTSVLIGPYWRGRGDADGDKYTNDYLGSSHAVKAGTTQLPPKRLSEWRYVGEVEEIWYRRHGKKYGGKRFRHKFNRPGLTTLVMGKGRARLYQHGEWYRLELPRGAIVDGRGFVYP